MKLTPDISRKALITTVFVLFFLILFLFCFFYSHVPLTTRVVMAHILDTRDNVLFRASLVITASYSQIASVTPFQSISFPLPPKKKKKSE